MLIKLIILIFLLFNFSNCQLPNSIILDENSGYNLQWSVNNDIVTFQVSVNKACWIGLGWHCQNCSSDGDMSNADYNIVIFDDNGFGTVYDCVTGPNYVPVNDTDLGYTNDIISQYSVQTESFSMMIFSKKLNTGDVGGDRVLIDGPNDFIWAHGSDNTFGFHGDGNAGRITVNLNTAQVSAPDQIDYVNWHASFMCVAFGLLMPFSIFSARFLKVFLWWWPLHYICNGLASICALIGFIMAIKMVGGWDFSTVHSIFGIITLSLVVASVVFGVLSHFLWKPTREKTPLFPDIIHWFLGRITFALSVAAIISGMVLHQVPYPVIFVFAGLIAFYFIIVLFIEIYKKKYPNYLDTSHQTPQYQKINTYFN